MCHLQGFAAKFQAPLPDQKPRADHNSTTQGQVTGELEAGSSFPGSLSSVDKSEDHSAKKKITPSLSNLPSEIIMMIGGLLRPKDLQKLLLTCNRFNQVLHHSLYKLACMNKRLSTTALFYAAARGNIALVKALLEKGTKITVMEYIRGPAPTLKNYMSRYEIIHETPDECYDELFGFVLKEAENLVLMWNGKAYTALHWAVKTEDKLLTALLLAKGAQPVFQTGLQEGSGPLHIAACRGGYNMTCFLLSRGFPVDQHDIEELTTLQAVLGRQQDTIICKSIVNLLLQRGASVTVKDQWLRTPLHQVVNYENWAGMVQILVGMGADVNAKNRWGATPLHIAAKLGNLKAVNELLVAGADVNIVNDQERTAWGLAVEYRRNDVACVLSLIGGSVED